MSDYRAELERVGKVVGGMIPAAAVRAGYNIANLSVSLTEDGENWTADIIGPRDVSNEPRWYMTRRGKVRAAGNVVATSGDIGSIWAPSADGLVDQVRQVAEVLHWADIKG